ncbi:MAG TPA: hypothetical protein VHD85_02130, partial [Terracidiphilus sp.]|nr:hypothetical protein [Terracidiphilus sp.]
MEFDGYFQDNFRMTRNLTWNIGLRWESHPAVWVKYGAMEAFDLKNHALVLASPPAEQIARGLTTQAIITNLENIGVKFETPQQAGLPNKLAEDYNFNFLPRVALAYQPFNGKWGTVIRGGYGRYIFPIPVRTSYKDEMRQIPHGAGYSQNYSLATQSPDGIQNYLLRTNTFPVAGQNSANVVDTTSTTAILPNIGLFTITPNEAPDFVTQVNFTIEQPLKGNSALRVSWLWTHGTNMDQEYHYNSKYNPFAWEVKTGTKTPQGKIIGQPDYAATALGPYDNTLWGDSVLDQKSGWTNDNQLQVNYQRLFHNGISYQIFYDWSQPFRVGGNYFRDGVLYTAENYVSSGLGTITQYPNESPITAPVLPPARPSGIASYAYWHALDKYEDYIVDTSVPRQAIQFNALIDLPFGRGKRYLGGVNRVLDEVVGGWEIAGDGTMNSQDFYVSNGNWGPTSKIKVYKSGKKVTDCRSGSCTPAYMWFNGYIPPSQLSASGCTAIVTNLPSGWTPYQQPLDTNYNPTSACGKAQDAHYNTNDVQINLLDGTTDKQGYSPGPSGGGFGVNPYAKTLLNGPNNFVADLSVFKVFPITESTR